MTLVFVNFPNSKHEIRLHAGCSTHRPRKRRD